MMNKKKKTALVALILALCIGLGSAALLEYYGRINVTTTVKQAVLVDGNSYPDIIIQEEVTVAGGESFCRPHYLTSQTSVPVTLQFDTTYVPEGDGITVTYSTQITDNNINFGERSNEVVAFPITSGLTLNDLFAGDGLSYTYTIIDGGTYDGASPVIAVIDLRYGLHIALFPGWGTRTGTHTLTYSETVSHETGGNNLADFVVYSTDFSAHLYGSVSCGYGNFADVKADTLNEYIDGTEVVERIAIQHQAANTGETDMLDSLKFSGTTYEFAIEENMPFILQPEQKLYFVICYKFAVDIMPGTYIITTEVQPV